LTEHHLFHTRHDFIPAIGWETFRLLPAAQNSVGCVEPKLLLDAAEAVASPLRRRRNIVKVLASFCDIGLLVRTRGDFVPTPLARALRASSGRWSVGFFAAVHGLYACGWSEEMIATPAWSYAETCRIVRDRGVLGLTADEIVLEIIDRARARFEVAAVSFSRSSVAGIIAWLEAQNPPLIVRDNGRIRCPGEGPPSADTIGATLAVTASKQGNPLFFDVKTLDGIATRLLLPTDLAFASLREYSRVYGLATWLDGTPPGMLMLIAGDPFRALLLSRASPRSTSANPEPVDAESTGAFRDSV